MDLPKTHEIISRELRKIPGLEVQEHKAGGFGIVAVMRGKRSGGNGDISLRIRAVCMRAAMTGTLPG